MTLLEFLCIPHIFKKYSLHIPKCMPIKNCYKLSQSGFLKSGPQPLHIGAERNVSFFTQPSRVDIRLNRICNHLVWFFFLQYLLIGTDQLKICNGINAPPIHIGFNTAKSHFLKIILMSHKRHTQHHFAGFHQLLNKLPSKSPEHIRMICNYQYFFPVFLLHISHTIPSSFPVSAACILFFTPSFLYIL